MIKTTIILLLFLLNSLVGFSKKIHINFEVMIELSELIISGEIISVDSTNYQYKINRTIKGKSLTDTITINKFKIWTCDPRPNYSVGQKSILFLCNQEEQYNTISGGDGEILIEGEDKIIVSDYKSLTFEEQKSGIIDNTKFIDLLTFSKAITTFTECVDFHITCQESSGPIFPMNYSLTCKKKDMDSLKGQEFLYWLFDSLKSYKKIK